jgi:hypothetical protein
MNLFAKHRPVQGGDRIIIPTWEEMKVLVDYTEKDPFTGVVKIYLDWGIHGKSRVYAHDEGKTWTRYVEPTIN